MKTPTLIKSISPILVLVLCLAFTVSQETDEKEVLENPKELGLVNWGRDYDAALTKAKEENKPVFLLFQEVPGCMNCQRFGRDVLSNPLIKDIIETKFIPVCVYNNKGGKDAEVLKKFNEPSWNNPVVRIIDQNEKELAKRMGRFHPLEIVNGIDAALSKANIEKPPYFSALTKSVSAQFSEKEEVVFSMYCFWSGELKLGKMKGVINTTPGFMNGQEVVKVVFDANQTTFNDVVRTADKEAGVDKVYTFNSKHFDIAKDIAGASRVVKSSGFRVDKEPKYYLSKTHYKHLPMLPIQRILVNRSIYSGKDPSWYLSPSQIELYQQIKKQKTTLPDLTLSSDLVQDWEDIRLKIKT